jgi:pyridoxine 5'-phosphate synthase PdxJ
MGLIGEIFADAGLHIRDGDFTKFAAELGGLEGKIGQFASGTQALMAGAFLVPAGVVTGIAAYGTQIASSYEDANLTLKTLYGSQDAAAEKFQWLQQFAASTPFEFPELLNAATQLKAYGMDVEQYGRTIGDTAAAMGKPIDMAVQALADAQQGEFERMKEFGVKAVEITSKNYQQLGASAQQAGQTALTYMDNNGKQQIAVVDRNNKEMVTSTIAAIWNSRYAGAMEERSKSFTGMLSTIKDNMTAGLADIAGFDLSTATVETGSLLGVLKELAGVGLTVTGMFANMSEPVQAFVTVVGVAVAGIGLLAAGTIAYTAAGELYATIMAIEISETLTFGAALSAAIWPATLIVGGLALLAAGMVYVNEQTGIFTKTFDFLSDVLTVASEEFDKLWDSLSSQGSYFIADLVQGFEDLWTILNNIATYIHLDDLLNFAWDVSPLKVAYDAAKQLWGILSEWGGGISEKADKIREANEGIGTSAEEGAKKTGEAATTFDTETGKIETSSSDMYTTVKNYFTEAGKSTGEIINGASTTAGNFDTETGKFETSAGDMKTNVGTSFDEAGKATDALPTQAATSATNFDTQTKNITQSAKTMLTEYQKTVKQMAEETANISTLSTVGGVTGGDKDIRTSIAPGGKGFKVSTGTKEYGEGYIGSDTEGKQVYSYSKYDEATKSVQTHTLSLEYLRRVGIDTFKSQDGLVKVYAYDSKSNMTEINNKMGEYNEKGIKVIPLNTDIANSHNKIAGAASNSTSAVNGTAAAHDKSAKAAGTSTTAINGTVDAENRLKVISLDDAAAETLKPGNSAKQSTTQVNTLGIKTGELNGIPTSTIANNIFGIGTNAGISTTQANGLKTGLTDVDGVSQANAAGQVAGVGTQAGNSTTPVGGLQTGLINVNNSSQANSISQLYGVGTSATNSSGNVTTLHGKITGLNGISLDGIMTKLNNVISWADTAYSKAKAALGVSNSSNTASNSSAYGYTKSEAATRQANMTVYNNSTKINTVNNNGTSISTNAVRRVT